MSLSKFNVNTSSKQSTYFGDNVARHTDKVTRHSDQMRSLLMLNENHEKKMSLGELMGHSSV
jgi:hypothetical protein